MPHLTPYMRLLFYFKLEISAIFLFKECGLQFLDVINNLLFYTRFDLYLPFLFTIKFKVICEKAS
ncbi:MAG: hypothetical protein RL732_465 [Bacteroidota bacterium]|jgi:hypothetical protein